MTPRALPSLNRVRAHVDRISHEHLDEFGEALLTEIDEEIQIFFELTDEEFESGDYSFAIYSHLRKKGLTN
jgi:hypothetical protein